MAYDVNKLVDELSPVQVELLIRKYVENNLHQVEGGYVSATFVMTQKASGHWTLYADILQDTKAKGEILALCTTELNRRVSADKANTLLLIEASPVAGGENFYRAEEEAPS